MPRKAITGQDEWVVTEALATALIALVLLSQKVAVAWFENQLRKALPLRIGGSGWLFEERRGLSAFYPVHRKSCQRDR
jgi:hypothetical protein